MTHFAESLGVGVLLSQQEIRDIEAGDDADCSDKPVLTFTSS